jgi:hypothetical protein
MVALALNAPHYRGPPVMYVPPGYQQVRPQRVIPLRVWRAIAAAMSQSEEREFIISQGEAFCRKHPSDEMCHPLDQQRR